MENIDVQLFEHLSSEVDHMRRELLFHSHRESRVTKPREEIVNN